MTVKMFSFKKQILLALGFVVMACATSPTGRSQLIMIDDNRIAPQAALSFEQMKKEEKISDKPAVNQYVQCVAQPLINEAKLQYQNLPADWDVVVFDSKAVNAFAMPGGKVGVYTGLIDLTENQDQLAAVVGHEIGHVMAHHAAERMSTAQLTILAMTAAGVALADNKDQAAIMAALGIGAQIGIQLPFSRVHEAEADEIGQDLMARAGFDPAQSIRLWELMEKSGDARPPELLSTHPDPANRAQHLDSLLFQNKMLYEDAIKMGKRSRCVLPSKPTTSASAPVSKPASTTHKKRKKKP
jgi:predicted Zn-dependent protease